ncbi:MAG TPA: SiaB family protein kinase [Bacteroidales bacterium]|nr:SiaB family protein kinase [Bacteroidales bacterium]
MEKQSIYDLKFVTQVREQMNANQLMLSYRGEISQDIVMALLNLVENKLSSTDSDNTLKARVFCVMVECLQNVTRYSEKDHHAESSIFMIGQSEQGYLIYSGNVINSAKVEELKGKLVKVNTMSEAELKEFHKYWMINGSLSPKNGFGLGLIHIARKTGNQLDFDFEPIDNDHYFFSLKTLVKH